jgi:hypothetical protein
VDGSERVAGAGGNGTRQRGWAGDDDGRRAGAECEHAGEPRGAPARAAGNPAPARCSPGGLARRSRMPAARVAGLRCGVDGGANGRRRRGRCLAARGTRGQAPHGSASCRPLFVPSAACGVVVPKTGRAACTHLRVRACRRVHAHIHAVRAPLTRSARGRPYSRPKHSRRRRRRLPQAIRQTSTMRDNRTSSSQQACGTLL